MDTSEGLFQQALIAPEIDAANELTRRWLTSRAAVPTAASGLGIWPLLGMLATGAVRRTRDELLAAAGVGEGRAAVIPKALLDALRGSPSIRLALGAWAGSRVTLDPDWVAGLPVDAVGSLTGDPAADKAALDAWASRGTDGLIDEIPLDFEQPVDIVLASALLVRTKWATPFVEGYEILPTGPWSGLGHCQTLSATLHGDVLRVAPEASVLTVPGDGGIDVLLCLGREDLAPQQVVSVLVDAATRPDWGRSSAELGIGHRAVGVAVTEYLDMRPQTGPEVAVRTVEFDLDADLDLRQDAAALGLVCASDKDFAEFDRLAAQSVYVSQARQSCTATFSATGFEAAAVTAMGMEMFGGMPSFDHRHVTAEVRFDRPFAYLARHRATGLILMAGWVDRPELA
jgi:hypothetical protein